jgi:hypothetical protein
LRSGHGEVARRDLPDTLTPEEAIELVVLETEGALASDDGGDGRDGSGAHDRPQHEGGGLAVVRYREPLGEHRALEGDDGRTARDGGDNVW